MNGTSLRLNVRSWLNQDNMVNYLLLANIILFLPRLFSYLVPDLKPVASVIEYHLGLHSLLPVLAQKPWGIITYMFMHAGFLHILFNMLLLHFFGNLFRSELGEKRVLPLYLLSSITGALFYLLYYNIVYGDVNGLLIGASASVLAYVVACATVLPNLELQLLLFGNVKLKWIALGAVVIDILTLMQGNDSNIGGIMAHFGGAAFGFVYVKALRAGLELGQPLIWLFGKIGLLFNRNQPAPSKGFRNFKPKKSPLKVVKRSGEENRQQKLDILLDKINERGYDSLTNEEKSWLKKYSNENG